MKKENFKPEVKSMIEHLQDELYQLENKQAKGAQLGATLLQLTVGGRIGQNAKFWEKPPQVHLIIIRE